MLFKNGDIAANKSMPVGGDSTQIKWWQIFLTQRTLHTYSYKA
jgi:hypothetical protein